MSGIQVEFTWNTFEILFPWSLNTLWIHFEYSPRGVQNEFRFCIFFDKFSYSFWIHGRQESILNSQNEYIWNSSQNSSRIPTKRNSKWIQVWDFSEYILLFFRIHGRKKFILNSNEREFQKNPDLECFFIFNKFLYSFWIPGKNLFELNKEFLLNQQLSLGTVPHSTGRIYWSRVMVVAVMVFAWCLL